MKINAVAQLYSGKQLVNEVEDITGQKINHVALIQFGGLVKVVDALGGVELCYDQDVDDPYSSLNWTAGCIPRMATPLWRSPVCVTPMHKVISAARRGNDRSLTPSSKRPRPDRP